MNVSRLLTNGLIFGTMLLLSACNNTIKPDEHNQEKNPVTNERSDKSAAETQDAEGIETGVAEVVQSINALVTEGSAEADPEKIQELGKKVSSDWDSIEKQVEDDFPDWYERIEKNLYPLIGESGNPEKDTEKIEELSKAAIEDLQLFLKEVN
ncbi:MULTISPECIES: hypothetical protein [Peribacillus]|uniref:Lipoprotein n=1 Tax=Peribacillus simplex TaxID=1478 RepID=A0A109N0I2_9BACI|nr:hypothetical protein [Peribacillus simplex]KWW21245.1 hypothetical protein AS888_16750 [Peribacillus simplex]